MDYAGQNAVPTPTPTRSPKEDRLADILLPPRRILSTDIRFEHISIEQGLSQNSVLCTLQDNKGFMWFGTWDGLNKYDGYNFTIYRHDQGNPHSLGDNTVWSLYEDLGGALWIGTGAGLDYLNRETGQFTHYQHNPNDPASLSDNVVLSIWEDPSGALWIGTANGGLNKLDRSTGRFTRYQHNPDDPYSLSSNSGVTIYPDTLRSRGDWTGMLWVGTSNGLNKFDVGTQRFTRYQHIPGDAQSLSDNGILTVYEDRSGTLWIGTNKGLDWYNRETGHFVHYQHLASDPHSLSDNMVWRIYEDRLGTLWIGTLEQGLDKFDREHGRFIHYRNDPNNPASLSNNRIRSIYEDRSGALWIGTDGGGLDKFDVGKKGFTNYQSDPNDSNTLSAKSVLAVYEDRSGVLWIGTISGGLDKFDRETMQFTHYRYDPRYPYSLSSNFILSLYEDHRGTLWIGTYEGGLERFDRKNDQFVHYQHNPRDPYSLSNPSVRAIYEDRDSMLWIGTWGGGLDKLDPTTRRFEHYRHNPDDSSSLSDNTVRTICEDGMGALWVGTENGLNRLDRETGRFTRYQHNPDDPNSLGDNFVLTIYPQNGDNREGASPALWIGTNGGGLDRFDPENEIFTHYGEKDGLPNNVVYGILEDNQGSLWLSTNKGLSKFNPRNGTFRNYEVRDGLQSNEFNEGSYYKSRSGEMFFGGVNGLTAFYPEDIKDNSYTPPIVLTSLTQSGEPVDASAAIENITEAKFSWPNNFFEFEFTALSYVQPEKNQYAYRLDNFDKDWNYIATRRFGRYTNLPGGEYTLRLKGSNNDGVWNEVGTVLKITIVPPFWEMWWFRGLAALTLIAGVLGGYRLRVKSVETRNRQLEALIKDRTHALVQHTREIEQQRQELNGLYQAEQRRAEQFRVISEVGRRITFILAVDELLDQIARLIQEAFNYHHVGIGLIEGNEVVSKAEAGAWRNAHHARRIRVGQAGGWGQVARSGEPLLASDISQESLHSVPIRSQLCVPLRTKEATIGVLSVESDQPNVFDDSDLAVLQSLANQAAVAIENARLYEQAQQLAVIEERGRLARDLHDAVTQTLFSASLIAEALPSIWENDQSEGRQLLDEMRRLNRGALAEMRNLLLELRPAALTEASLGDLLRQLTEAVTGRKDIAATVNIEGQCVLPSDVHIALYRIAQEALNNVVKHARASHVVVHLRCIAPEAFSPAGARPEEAQETRVELQVSDDGRGFDPSSVSPNRLGLSIVRERAQAIGALLEIESQVGRGTRIKIVWTNGRQTATSE